jgi:hypothetical protein
MGNYFLHLRLSTMLMTMMMAIDGNDDGEWIEVFRLVAEFDASFGLRGIQLHPRLEYYDCAVTIVRKPAQPQPHVFDGLLACASHMESHQQPHAG